VRQEIGRLGHQVDAQVLVLDADMHMAAADQHPPRRRAEVGAQPVIALLAGVGLAAPRGEGVGRGGDRGKAELGRRLGDGAAHCHQLGLRLADRAVRPGADLYLALQELGRHLLAQKVAAALEKRRVGLAHHVARLALDDEVFLLDADGEARAFDHGRLPCLILQHPTALNAGQSYMRSNPRGMLTCRGRLCARRGEIHRARETPE